GAPVVDRRAEPAPAGDRDARGVAARRRATAWPAGAEPDDRRSARDLPSVGGGLRPRVVARPLDPGHPDGDVPPQRARSHLLSSRPSRVGPKIFSLERRGLSSLRTVL